MCDDDRVEPDAGCLLVATPRIGDSVFHRSVVLILDHGAAGTAGVILNRPLELSVDELSLDVSSSVVAPPFVFDGGPVEQHGVLGVTRNGAGVVCPADLNRPGDIDGPLRLYLGHAGWAPSQLAEELAEEAWWVVRPDPADVFATEPEELWFEVVRRFADQRSWLSIAPDDPAQN